MTVDILVALCHREHFIWFQCWSSNSSLVSFVPLTQIQTVTKKVEVVIEEDVNATTVEGLVANITKEPQYIIKKSLQFKSGMNVLGM